MIKAAERKKMKKVLKTGYSKEVQELLSLKNVVNQKGLPYGISYITHVFNGRNSNLDIEETILELYQKRCNDAKKLKLRRKEIFDTKKPEAGTSGLI